MNLVRQEHARGCGPACVAMILGVSYAEALLMFPPRDWEKHGLNQHSLLHELAGRGIAVATRYSFGDMNARTDPWPPRPFAAAHLCQVVVAPQSQVVHFCLWLDDGRVLDPILGEHRDGLERYHRLNQVCGLGRVTGLGMAWAPG